MSPLLSEEELVWAETRDINLLPRDGEQGKRRFRFRVIFVSLCLALLCLAGMWWNQERQKQLASLRESLELSEMQRLKKEEVDLRCRVMRQSEIWSQFSGERLSWEGFVGLVGEAAERGVVWREIRYKNDELVLEGKGRECSAVVDLSDDLSAFAGVKKVSSMRLDYRDDGQVDFVLVVELLWQEHEAESLVLDKQRTNRSLEATREKEKKQALLWEISRLRAEDEMLQKVLIPRPKTFLLSEVEELAQRFGVFITSLEAIPVPEPLVDQASKNWECWRLAFEAYGPPEGVRNWMLAISNLNLVRIQEFWWKKEISSEEKTEEEVVGNREGQEVSPEKTRVFLNVKVLCESTLYGKNGAKRGNIRLNENSETARWTKQPY